MCEFRKEAEEILGTHVPSNLLDFTQIKLKFVIMFVNFSFDFSVIRKLTKKWANVNRKRSVTATGNVRVN